MKVKTKTKHWSEGCSGLIQKQLWRRSLAPSAGNNKVIRLERTAATQLRYIEYIIMRKKKILRLKRVENHFIVRLNMKNNEFESVKNSALEMLVFRNSEVNSSNRLLTLKWYFWCYLLYKICKINNFNLDDTFSEGGICVLCLPLINITTLVIATAIWAKCDVNPN